MATSKKSTPKTEVEVIAAPVREMQEDATAKAGGEDISPEAVYAELDKLSKNTGYVESPERMRPVAPAEIQSKDPDVGDAELREHGAVFEGDTVRFGDKVFFGDKDDRRTVPNKMNLAAGPRLTQLPTDGTFLQGTRSFRRVPYRRPSGAIRTDN